MDQGPATAAGASLISLSEIEQKYYSGLYTSCKADSCGRLSASKVAELFRASQLPAETLHQVTEVCGAKRLGYFGVEQFHVALKLLAAAQMGLPVHQGSVKGELPLPIFVGIQNNAEDWYAAQSQHIDSRSRQCGAAPGLASRAARLPDNAVDQQEFRSSPHSARSSSPDSLSANQSSAYSAQRNGTDTLLAQPTHGPGWPGTQSENYSPSHYRSQSSMDNPSVTQARSVERPVDPDVADDPWRITGEQLEYYTYQFKSLQPDLGALILGAVAKNFFTKSKLPILELSHIWELSDTDRDGALSFPEFCTAFHLIVARKNGYPLPESLPPALQPGLTGQDRDPPGPLAEAGFFGGLSVLRQAEFVHVETEPLISFEETAPEPILLEKNRVEIQSPVSETTTPTQELTDGPSKSERGPKKAVETENGPNKSSWPGPARELDPQSRTRLRPRSYSSTSIDDAMKKPPTPPPRPQKTHSRASSLDLNRLLLQSSQGFKSVWLPSPPPPPALPPRPPVPVVPPPATRGAVIPPPATTQVQNLVNAEEQSPPSKPAVGREDADLIKTESLLSQKPVRRKYRPESQNLGPASSSPTSGPYSTIPTVPTLGTKAGQKLPNRQPKEIQTAIRKNKETNAVLIRLNTQLQQQLKEVHQERLSLESQLETLKSISFV